MIFTTKYNPGDKVIVRDSGTNFVPKIFIIETVEACCTLDNIESEECHQGIRYTCVTDYRCNIRHILEEDIVLATKENVLKELKLTNDALKKELLNNCIKDCDMQEE